MSRTSRVYLPVTASTACGRVQPPSIVWTLPVMEPPASVVRNRASSARCSGDTKRLLGWFADQLPRCIVNRNALRSGRASICFCALAGNRPSGQIALQGNLRLCVFQRRYLGQADDAVLGRNIGAFVDRRYQPCADATLMMRPQPALHVGRAILLVWNALDRLMGDGVPFVVRKNPGLTTHAGSRRCC